jgi:hypothetical protein
MLLRVICHSERREELEEPVDSDTDEDERRENIEVETAHWTFTAFIGEPH